MADSDVIGGIENLTDAVSGETPSYEYKNPNTDMMKAISKCIDAATGETGTEYEYDNPNTDVIQKMDELADAIATHSGGESSLDRLLFLECVGRDTPQIPAVNKLIKEDIFNEYLSFDDLTKKFTVLKSFDAVVVAWVYQYNGAMSTGQGAFYVNDTETYAYNTNGNGLGAVGGVSNIIHFEVGDKFWVYTRSSSGYPQQYLKVYVESGLTSGNAISPIGLSTNIQEIASLYFLNEISN